VQRLYSSAVLVAALCVAACSDSSVQRLERMPLGVDVERLRMPAAIRITQRDKIVIAENGGRRFRFFSLGGASLPEEDIPYPSALRQVQDFVASDSGLWVLDTAYALLNVSRKGVLLRNLADTYESNLALSGTLVVLSSSPQWSLPLPKGRRAWPLARMMTWAGDSGAELAGRVNGANPFASHIANFVIAAGTRDGQGVWLAHLNAPVVSYLDLATMQATRYDRAIPFGWRKLAGTFRPSSINEGQRAPFDPVALGIATDSLGHAYVLTPRNDRTDDSRMFLDIFSHKTGLLHRYLLDRGGTHVAVASNGRAAYVLDERSRRVFAYSIPE